MSKEAFLTELAGHLKVLEEREQQDILDEYAQHIDMKIQNGMSEEEAIRDFGPVKELAAEILEAYHVNPEYGDSSRRVKMDFESAAQKLGCQLIFPSVVLNAISGTFQSASPASAASNQEPSSSAKP